MTTPAPATAARVATLARVAAMLVVDQPLVETMHGVARAVRDASSAVAVSIQLLDRDTGGLALAVCEGLPAGYESGLHASWRAGVRSPTSDALREQRSRLVLDAVSTGRATPEYAPLHPYLDEVEWDSILVLPLDSQGRSLGALNAYYRRGQEPDDDETSFITATADMAAVAVQNARLVGELREGAAVSERQRLARELHDSVSQALYGIALGARTAGTLIERDPAAAAQPLEYVVDLAQAALTEMRALIFALRPEALATEGLLAALHKHADALRVRHALHVELEVPADEPEMSAAARDALYRITAEALHNITKHAQARSVHLSLRTEGHDLVLEVRDDGVGFDPSLPRPGHLGLQSMRERATACGGSLTVESRSGAGSRLLVRVPQDGARPPA